MTPRPSVAGRLFELVDRVVDDIHLVHDHRLGVVKPAIVEMRADFLGEEGQDRLGSTARRRGRIRREVVPHPGDDRRLIVVRETSFGIRLLLHEDRCRRSVPEGKANQSIHQANQLSDGHLASISPQKEASMKSDLFDGLRGSTPILISTIPFAALYGAVAVANGQTVAEATLMSAIVFAGASQLVGIELFATTCLGG